MSRKIALALSESEAKKMLEGSSVFRDATSIKRISISERNYRIFFWDKDEDPEIIWGAVSKNSLYYYVEVTDSVIYSDVKIDNEEETDGNFKKLISWVTRIFCPVDGEVLG